MSMPYVFAFQISIYEKASFQQHVLKMHCIEKGEYSFFFSPKNILQWSLFLFMILPLVFRFKAESCSCGCMSIFWSKCVSTTFLYNKGLTSWHSTATVPVSYWHCANSNKTMRLMGHALVKGQWYNSFTLSVPKHTRISLIYTIIE